MQIIKRIFFHTKYDIIAKVTYTRGFAYNVMELLK